MKISNDDNFCFSAGEDGSLVIYSINDKDSKIRRDKEGGTM